MTVKEYDGRGLFFRGERVDVARIRELPAMREQRVMLGPLVLARWRGLGWIDEQGRLTIPEPETSE